jgi:hypothetical protein
MTRTTRPRPRLRRVAAAAAAVGLTFALSACLSDQVGTAAIVGGDRVSEADVQSQVRELQHVVPNLDTATAQQGVLRDLILAKVYDELARKYHVHVTDAEVASQLDQIYTQVQQQARQAHRTPKVYVVQQLAQSSQQAAYVAPSHLDDWLHAQLLAQRIQAKIPDSATASRVFVAANKKLDITVNPRYGTWNPSKGLQAEVGGGLSKTQAQLSSS